MISLYWFLKNTNKTNHFDIIILILKLKNNIIVVIKANTFLVMTHHDQKH
jgi:hypothetical protein